MDSGDHNSEYNFISSFLLRALEPRKNNGICSHWAIFLFKLLTATLFLISEVLIQF